MVGTNNYQCVVQGYDAADHFRTKYCMPDDFRFLYIVDSIPALCCFYEGALKLADLSSREPYKMPFCFLYL